MSEPPSRSPQKGPRRSAIITRLEALLAWPARRPFVALTLATVLTLGAVFAIAHMKVNSSLEVLFARDDPSAQAMARVTRDFASLDNLVLEVSLPATSKADDVPPDSARLVAFADRLLHALVDDPKSNDLLRSVQYEAGPASRQFIQTQALAHLPAYLSDAAFAQFQARLTPAGLATQFQENQAMMAAPGAGQALARTLIKDPLRLRDLAIARFKQMLPVATIHPPLADGRQPWLSADGRHLMIVITGMRSASDMAFVKALTTSIDTAVRKANTDHLLIQTTGGYAVAREAEASIRHDMIVSTIGSIILIQILFLLTFRHIASFVGTFLPVAAGIIWGFGLAAVLGMELTAPVAVVGAMLAGLGIDQALHFLAHVQARPSISWHNLKPMLGALLTTLAALAVIAFSNVQGLEDFALLGMAGLVGALLASLLILPAGLALLGRHGRDNQKYAQPRLWLVRLPAWVARRPRGTLGVGVAISLTIMGIAFIRHGPVIPFDSNLQAMHPQPNVALEVQKQLAVDFAMPADFLAVYLKSDSPQHLVSLAHDLNTQLSQGRAELHIAGVTSLADFLPDPRVAARRKAALEEIDVTQTLADFRTASDAHGFKPKAFEPYEKFLAQLLRPGRPLTLPDLHKQGQLASEILPFKNQNVDDITEALTLIWLKKPLVHRQEQAKVIHTLREELGSVQTQHAGGQLILTGMSVMAYDTQARIGDALWKLSIFAAVGVLGMMFVMLQRPWRVATALLPMIMGMITALAGLHLWGGGLNMINLIGLPLLLGVSVDYGIFMVSASEDFEHTGHDAPALEHLGRSTHASTLCCLTTILGFGSVITASTPAMASLGVMLGAGMVGSMIGALLLTLPVLLWRADAKHPRRELV